MKKCQFVTGFTSLSLAMIIGITSIASGVEATSARKLVCEYETATTAAIVEWSAIERNVLTVSELNGMETEVIQLDEGETALAVQTKQETVTRVESKTSEETSTENTNKKANKKKTKKNNKKKSNDKKMKSVGTFKVSAYCSCSSCCGKSNGITASGTKAKAGRTIAADTSKFPFGTKLIIDGKTYVVEDRGGAISGNKIDLYCSSHQEALNWGVRYYEVYVAK